MTAVIALPVKMISEAERENLAAVVITVKKTEAEKIDWISPADDRRDLKCK